MPLHENDRPLDGAIRESLKRDVAPRESCPSPDVFAAYFEHSLDPEETAFYDRHFTTCKSCRQILAGVARANANHSDALAESSSRWAWLKKPIWLVPATAIAAVVAVVLTVELLPHRNSATEPATQIASVDSIARPASSPSPAPASAPAPGANAIADARSELDLHASATPPPVASQLDELAPRPSSPRVTAPEVRAPKTDSYSNAPAALAARSRYEAASQAKAFSKMAVPAKPAPSSAQAEAAVSSVANQNVVVTSAQGADVEQTSAGSGRVVVASPDAGIVWTVIPGGRVDFSGNTANSAVHDFLPTTNPISAGSSPGGKICWLVGTAGTILRTTDGRGWLVVPPPTNADFTAVQATSATSATVTAADGRKFSTLNAGQTWQSPK